MKALRICIHFVIFATFVDAWKQCPPEEGGGICPEGNTCCPTRTPGVSSCIPGRARDPEGAKGQCCDNDGTTGCPYGYQCAVTITKNPVQEEEPLQQICKRQEPHTEDMNAAEIPRYKLCQLPLSPLSDTYELQRFPIDGFNAVYYSSMGSILPTTNDNNNDNSDDNSIQEMQKFSSVETVVVVVHGSGRNADDYLCAGISTAETAATSNNNEYEKNIISNRTNLGNSRTEGGKILVIAPKFLADVDEEDRNRFPNTLYWLEHGKDVPLGHTWRYGADAANTLLRSDNNQVVSIDGKNHQAGISSYAIMDRFLEFIIGAKRSKSETQSLRQSIPRVQDFYYFPKLKRVVVAGHSAGGQYVHRWSMLSSSPLIWGDGDDVVSKENSANSTTTLASSNRNIEMRMVVANPRSYCYPDNRRMIRTEKGAANGFDQFENNPIKMEVTVYKNTKDRLDNDNAMGIDKPYSYRFALPDPRDVNACPTYDQWQWGLEPGGDVLCPFKDAALDLLGNNRTELTLRYSKRKVFYLAGEHDTIIQDDRCETFQFQGDHRNERARRYYRGLTEYLATLRNNPLQSGSTTNTKSTNGFIHEFHQVAGSPHDHTLMFQSEPSREAFYGTDQENNAHEFKRDRRENSLRTTSIQSQMSKTSARNLLY